MGLFEQAAKLKLRIVTSRGAITVEDLWDLDLTNSTDFNLDAIAVDLSRQWEETGQSFVVKKSRKDKVLELKFNIVKRVIVVKLQEIDSNKIKAEARIRRDKLLSIIEGKQDEELQATDMKDLNKELKSLGKVLR